MFAISVHVVKGATELCHLTTDPVCPDKVSTSLAVPVQIVVPPATLPPTEVGSTVTTAEAEFTAGQLPL